MISIEVSSVDEQRMVEHFSLNWTIPRSMALIDMQIVSFIGLKWSANSFIAHPDLRWQLHENFNGSQFNNRKKKIDGREEVALVITRWNRSQFERRSSMQLPALQTTNNWNALFC